MKVEAADAKDDGSDKLLHFIPFFRGWYYGLLKHRVYFSA